MKEKKTTATGGQATPASGKSGKDSEKRYDENLDMNREMADTMGLFGSQLDDVRCGDQKEDLEQGSEFISENSVKSKNK